MKLLSNLITWAVAIYIGFIMAGSLTGPGPIAGLVRLLAPLLICFAALFLLIIPILAAISVHRSQWMSLEPRYIWFHPEEADAAPEFLETLAEAEAKLLPLGFDTVRAYRTERMTPNARGFVALFVHPRTSEVAKVIGAVAQSKQIRTVSSYLIFLTEFADGTEVGTSNRTSLLGIPRKKPPFYPASFPEVRTADRLLAVHRARVEPFDAGRLRVEALTRDPDRYMRERDHLRGLAHHVACGYFYNDEPAGVQRLTWRGAILMAYKLLPPGKQILLAHERSQGAWVLRRLGFSRSGAAGPV